MPTAVLIDGGFFLRRYHHLRGNATPERVARDMHWMCRQHLEQERGPRRLYRIFFYDCLPLTKRVHNPVSGRAIDFSKTPTALWRLAFHDELRKLRKVALRLGYLNERLGHWEIHSTVLKQLFAKKMSLSDLTEESVKYEVRQKGVDMRIGLDIAAMAFKKQVDQIVLVSGDSDFVPAAKLARREGIDFLLDPMWASIRDDLHEHIDGLRSVFSREPSRRSEASATPSSDNPASAPDQALDGAPEQSP